MKSLRLTIFLVAAAMAAVSCGAGFDSSRALVGGVKALQAASVTDAQIQAYVHQYIEALDAQSPVLPESDAYVKRLRKLTAGLTDVDGVPLNFKVYKTNDVNAFACADGSVRVYTGLMDLMDDNEVLGVIGHEIGHVALKHTKKQMKHALMTSAALDAVASTGQVAAALTDSQLGALGEAISGAQFSQKQESQADDFGYEFIKAAGKNPWAMAMAFEKLQSISGGSTAGNAASGRSSGASILSSHPSTASRIANMSKRATADGFKRPASSKK